MTANGKSRFGDDYPSEHVTIDGTEYLDTDDPASDTSLLEPPETTSLKCPKWSYRGRFLDGKVEEYEATLEAYANSSIDEKGNHVKALKECRTYATLRRDFATGDVMVFGDSCRDRWCPMWAGQKAAYAKDQVTMYIKSLVAPRFLTLTVKNCENDLKTQITNLQESFARLRARAYWKRNVKGGVWFLEVKRGKNSDMWHPHLHILFDGNYLEHAELSALWELVTYGSPIIYITKVSDIEKASKYVSKYCSKPAQLKNMPLCDRVETIDALFRKRLCGTFGTAKAVTLTPPKIEATGEWDYVGHYDDIVERARFCPLSKAIMIAYNTGQALSVEVYIKFTGHDPGPVVHEIKPPKVDRQMYLDFYNTG